MNRFCCLLLAVTSLTAVADWEKPKTTRRYLQGPLAERLLVAYREGKIVHGEMCHDHDWLRRRYLSQSGFGVWLVHGAGDEPFDFRTARLRVDPEGVPIHGQSWQVGGLNVDFEACSPIERIPCAHVRVKLTNGGADPVSEKIGFLVRNSHEEMLVFGAPDIYRIYNPRVRSWKGLDCTWRRSGDAVVLEDLFVSFRGDSAATWDEEEGVLRFAADLKPGETKTFDLVLGRRPQVVRPDYGKALAETREGWRRELARAKDLTLLEKCLLVQILQCYARANGTDIVLPRQGGLQRWVWPWDQSYASAALTQLGYGEYVEMACDFYFGQYAQADGMVGPFGMGWVNDTASVLGIFSRHCLETGNRAYWQKHRAAAERAFGWIKAQRALTAGSADQVPGLFPKGRSSDMTAVFQSWGTTDLLNLQGLELYARAAAKFGDPMAAEAAREAADYRSVLTKILARWRQASSGQETFMIPYRPDGADERLLRDKGFFYCHPGYFAFFGFLDANDMERVRAYMLKEGLAHACGLYFRQPDRKRPEIGERVWYTTAAEYNWFFAWKRVGRDDLARQALDACLRYAVTDEYQVGERFHEANPWYLPWSPNASGAGRILQMLRAEKADGLNWAPDVKKGIVDLVASVGVESPGYDPECRPYAVFDFDNTTCIFDIQYQSYIYQLETMRFALTPDSFRTTLMKDVGATALTNMIADAMAAYGRLWTSYGPFTAAGVTADRQTSLTNDVWWLEFASKMRTLAEREDELPENWPVRWFAGMRNDEIYAVISNSCAKYSAVASHRQTLAGPPEAVSAWGPVTNSFVNGLSVTPEIRWLYRTLSENGIDVWICSASEISQIRAAVDCFGLHPWVTGAVAKTMRFDAEGRMLPEYDYETGFGFFAEADGKWRRNAFATHANCAEGGKVEAILSAIAPHYGNRGPVAGFMDATGDFNFCTEFADMRLVVCFNRANGVPASGAGLVSEVAVYERDFLGYDLAKANDVGDTLYLLQGRDENGFRGLVATNATRCFGSADYRLFKGAANERQLDRMISQRLSVAEAFDTYATDFQPDFPGYRTVGDWWLMTCPRTADEETGRRNAAGGAGRRLR